LQDKDLYRSQVVVCKIADSRAQQPNPCRGRLQVQSRVVVCKIGQALPHIPLALPGAVPLNRVGLGDAILLPITGMVDAPLAGAVAADLAVLRIQCQLPDAVLIPALLLDMVLPNT